MGRTVLVIDDEPDICEVLSARLQALKWDVVIASNGEEGLAALDTKKPDLILLDVMMPIMDGFEFYKNLKRNKDFSGIPTIVITARKLMRDTFEALGVDDFIGKPIDNEELESKIDFVLAQKALVLCDDSEAIENITKALASNGYKAYVAHNEDDLLIRGKAAEYKIVILHIAFLKQTPEEILPRIASLLCSDPLIIPYSDASLEGTEDGSTLAIEEAKTVWVKNKVSTFFDPRLVAEPFEKVLGGWLKQLQG